MTELEKIIKEHNIVEQIHKNPKMFKFLKTQQQIDAFVDGYNYCQREVLIILKKLEKITV